MERNRERNVRPRMLLPVDEILAKPMQLPENVDRTALVGRR
jgi:hypothetical protein